MNPGLEEKLSALLDGELSPEEAEVLRAEIARSPELALHFAALAAVDYGLRALPSPRVPTDLRARVERRVRRDDRAQIPRARRRWFTAAAFAAAAAAALALVQLWRDETQVARTEPSPAPAAAPTHEEPAAEDVAPAQDLPVIEVLDVLAELDELEEVGSG